MPKMANSASVAANTQNAKQSHAEVRAESRAEAREDDLRARAG